MVGTGAAVANVAFSRPLVALLVFVVGAAVLRVLVGTQAAKWRKEES